MVYRTTYLSGGGACGCGPDDDGFETTLRQFWAESYNGIYRGDYQSGYDTGKADLAAESYAGLNALDLIEVSHRDIAWSAQVDGYREATKVRGPTKFG